jgi:ACDE family multidrug resistance protein
VSPLHAPDPRGSAHGEAAPIRHGYPAPVLATAAAVLIAFTGIGVVDPILPVIVRAMGATKAQVEWLFTSYIAIMAVAMLVSGVIATHLGARRTMLAGLALVVVCATASGLSGSVGALAGWRGGWGMGNALFTPTALALIVGLSPGGLEQAIALYEAALGLGIATGPLIGGFLGSLSWRYPFFGTATLMAGAFTATSLMVPDPRRREPPRGARDILAALAHPAVRTNALAGLGYAYGFFTLLAYSPLYLNLSAVPLGLTYFAWGALVAVSSVWLAAALRPRLGALPLLRADLLALAGVFAAMLWVRGVGAALVLVVASGLFMGIANALFTSLAMEVSPYTRSISSGAYNFLRWSGAALAPVLSGLLAQRVGPRVPFAVSLGTVLGAAAVLAWRGRLLEAALADGSVPRVP